MASGTCRSLGSATNHLTNPTPLRDSLVSSVIASRRMEVNTWPGPLLPGSSFAKQTGLLPFAEQAISQVVD